jgi:hypothetical protein
MTIYRSKQFDFPHYGLISGHIEIDNSFPLRPLQRHIWTRQDGSEDAEEWISTIRVQPEEQLLAKGWTKLA